MPARKAPRRVRVKACAKINLSLGVGPARADGYHQVRTVLQAIEAGHLLADTDPDQLVFELDGLFIALMREARFLRDPHATDRSWAAYERVIRSAQSPHAR